MPMLETAEIRWFFKGSVPAQSVQKRLGMTSECYTLAASSIRLMCSGQ